MGTDSSHGYDSDDNVSDNLTSSPGNMKLSILLLAMMVAVAAVAAYSVDTEEAADMSEMTKREAEALAAAELDGALENEARVVKRKTRRWRVRIRISYDREAVKNK